MTTWTPNYFTRYAKMPLRIEAVTIPNDDGTFDIYVNTRLPDAIQRTALEHEIEHIIHDHFYKELPIAAVEAEANGEKTEEIKSAAPQAARKQKTKTQLRQNVKPPQSAEPAPTPIRIPLFASLAAMKGAYEAWGFLSKIREAGIRQRHHRYALLGISDNESEPDKPAAPIQFNDYNDYKIVDAPDRVPTAANAFIMTGKDMEPYIKDGAIVYFEPNSKIDVGDIGVFYVDDELHCKQFLVVDGVLYLAPLNKRYNTGIRIWNFERTIVCGVGKVLMERKPVVDKSTFDIYSHFRNAVYKTEKKFHKDDEQVYERYSRHDFERTSFTQAAMSQATGNKQTGQRVQYRKRPQFIEVDGPEDF